MSTDRNVAINEIVTATLRGKLTRREALKRAAALGMTAPFFAYLLNVRAYGVAAQGPGSTIVVPQGLRTDLKGQKVERRAGRGRLARQTVP